MQPTHPLASRTRGHVFMAWLLLAIALIPTATRADFDPEYQAHVTVYGRVPERVSSEIDLRFARFEIFTAGDTYTFEPQRGSLATPDDAGRAPVLLRAAFSAGRIDSLRVILDSAQVVVGEASTSVDLAELAVTAKLSVEAVPGECFVLHLEFDPDATPLDADPWRPDLEFGFVERPPLGQAVFTALEAGGTVAVLDRRSQWVAVEFGVGGRPTDLVYSPVERRLFVTVAERDELVAVDLGDIDRMRRLPLRFGDAPSRLVLSADERDVLVLSSGHDALVAVSSQTFQETVRIPLTPRPVALAADARSARVFVSSGSTRAVEVVDLTRSVVVETFAVRDMPGEMIYLPEARELLVATQDGRSIERLDARSGASLESIEMCGPTTGMALQERSQRVFVAMELCRELSVLRPRLDVEVARQALRGDPGRLRLDPEERMLYVPMPSEGTLLVINSSRVREMSVIDVGPRPVAVVIP